MGNAANEFSKTSHFTAETLRTQSKRWSTTLQRRSLSSPSVLDSPSPARREADCAKHSIRSAIPSARRSPRGRWRSSWRGTAGPNGAASWPRVPIGTRRSSSSRDRAGPGRREAPAGCRGLSCVLEEYKQVIVDCSISKNMLYFTWASNQRVSSLLQTSI